MDEMIQTINAHADEAARKEAEMNEARARRQVEQDKQKARVKAELAEIRRQEDFWAHGTTVALLATAAVACMSFSLPGWMSAWLSHALATVFGAWALLATGYYVGRGKR